MKYGYRERRGRSSWRGCASQRVWGCFREERGKNESEVKMWRKEDIPISRHNAKTIERKDCLPEEDTEAAGPSEHHQVGEQEKEVQGVGYGYGEVGF